MNPMADKEPPLLSEPSRESLEALLNAAETARVFRAAGARWRDGILTSKFDAVREAVCEILSAQLPEVDVQTLELMAESISVALMMNSSSASRLDALLGEK